MVVSRRTGCTEIDSRRKFLVTWLLALASFAAVAPGSAGAAVDRHPCRDAPPGTRCGSITVPLDRSGAVRGRIKIEFERYLRRDRTRPAAGTMLAIEGGPGYSTTDSRAGYLTLLAPLRARRDLLLVDLRGTGLSGPLDCPALRRTVKDYVRRAGPCAREIGARRDFYGTHAAVDDVAAVLDALRIGRVDLYGDSYGTFAAQAFAVHHGDRLRSLVLDGAYPVTGTDPAFSDLAEATQRALRLVCARRASCATRGEDPIAVVGRLVARVRAGAVTGSGRDADGNRVRVRLDERSVAGLIQSGYGNVPMYRDLLAAIRAFEAGDRAPLLRLFAENTLDTTAYPVRSFSEGLLPRRHLPRLPAAVGSRRTDRGPPRAARADDRGDAARAVRADLPRRLDRPRLRGRHRLPQLARAGPARPAGAARRDLPGRPHARAQRRPRQHHGLLRRAHRRVAIPARDVRGDRQHDPRLGHRRPRRLRRPARAPLHPPAHAPATPVAPAASPRSARSIASPAPPPAPRPREPRAGDRSTRAQRRAAAVAAATVADAIQRWALNTSGASRGLRGGRWSFTGTRVVRFRFRRRPVRARRRGQRDRHLAPRRRRGARTPPPPGPRAAARSAGAPGARSPSRRSTARSAAGRCAGRCSPPDGSRTDGTFGLGSP